MRIIFMGTPDFAAASLKKLIDDGRNVVGVFSQPDKPSKRGMKVAFSPVKELAIANGIPVYQPEKMRDGEALAILKELQPDIIVVVAYGRILPEDILSLPKYGCINVHGSLLPKYRGSAPIQWAVLNGDAVTGVTTMYLAPEMDAGDIILFDKTGIGEFETSGELFDRLSVMGAELLVKTLDAIAAGTAVAVHQDEEQVSYAPRLTKEMSPIDWNRSPRQIVKHICGMQPWPVATANICGTEFRVFDAAYTNGKTDKAPGRLVSAGKNGIEVACANGETLILTTIQAAGGKRMAAADYLRGHKLEAED